MKFSPKGRSALHAMVDLMQHSVHGPVALYTISRRQGISLSHLEKMFAELRVHGLVVSVTGPGGGYLLARPARLINAADVIAAVSRHVVDVGCDDRDDWRAEAKGLCVTRELWASLDEHLLGYLRSVTLEHLAAAPPEPISARHVTRREPSCVAG